MLQIISGNLRGMRLSDSYPTTTRPVTSRMLRQIFDIIRSVNGSVLDLFAGTGILGFEALSRGAEDVTAVENNIANCRLIDQVITKYHLHDRFTIKHSNANTFIINKQYDLIFIDPPYERGMLNTSIENLIRQDALKEDGLIIIKSSKREPIVCQLIKCIREEKHGDSRLSFWNI